MGDAESSSSVSRATRAVKNISQRMKSKPDRLDKPERFEKPESTFAPSDILPQDGQQPYPKRAESDLRPSYEDQRDVFFGSPAEAPMSGRQSTDPPSVFDPADGQQEHETEPTTRGSDEQEPEQESYDLKPPPPTVSHENMVTLAARLFSTEHLDFILRDHNAGPRFVQFLEQYKPQYSETLQHYIKARKALTAVQYANAIADGVLSGQDGSSLPAAKINESFDARAKQIAEDLVEEALPSYLTHRFTTVVTDVLVKTITNNNIPAMQELVPNLAEVYCISDPSLPDNPIVYASEEFYNTSQYGREYVIGRNCRFLQGPQTSPATVRRMAEALSRGEELCETIVNYRRDGTPFMNLLLLAPMYDNKGDVRYYLGAQIDVSPLVEGGKGLDSFSQLLAQDRANRRYDEGRDPMDLLGQLRQMLNEDETDFVMKGMWKETLGSQRSSGASTPVRPSSSQSKGRPSNRRFLSMDDFDAQHSAKLWPDSNLGKSGRLPGVYRNYLLVRPYPSLRITFTSPTLRIPGLLQTKLLDRIGGPPHLKQGIADAFRNGTRVTAKVPWISYAGNKNGSGGDGKPRWIHCTPLFGSDERVGVWMVVLVENEEVTGLLNQQGAMGMSRQGSARSGGGRMNGDAIELGPVNGAETPGSMYADYMRDSREGARPGTSESTRERREVDEHFRDF